MSTTKGASWLTAAQLALEMGCTTREAEKALAKVVWCYPPRYFTRRHSPKYDARALDLLRALRGQPHRTLEPTHSDWLARYVKENP